MEKKLKELVEEFLKQLTVDYTDVKITKDESEYFHVDIQTPETGLLIGFHGETIRSLELILKLAAYKQLGEHVKLNLNIGDYQEQKEERLKFLADRMIEKLKATREDVTFPWLSPGERRVIHMYLKDNSEVEAVSEGEEKNRRLILRLKNT
jgi:spoIIIJ-associated protein